MYKLFNQNWNSPKIKILVSLYQYFSVRVHMDSYELPLPLTTRYSGGDHGWRSCSLSAWPQHKTGDPLVGNKVARRPLGTGWEKLVRAIASGDFSLPLSLCSLEQPLCTCKPSVPSLLQPPSEMFLRLCLSSKVNLDTAPQHYVMQARRAWASCKVTADLFLSEGKAIPK